MGYKSKMGNFGGSFTVSELGNEVKTGTVAVKVATIPASVN